MKYTYNKKTGKFTEDGHTMFEQDVLQRLNRLAYLEKERSKPTVTSKCSVQNSKGFCPYKADGGCTMEFGGCINQIIEI